MTKATSSTIPTTVASSAKTPTIIHLLSIVLFINFNIKIERNKPKGLEQSINNHYSLKEKHLRKIPWI